MDSPHQCTCIFLVERPLGREDWCFMERVFRDWNYYSSDHHCSGLVEHSAPNFATLYYCTECEYQSQSPGGEVMLQAGPASSMRWGLGMFPQGAAKGATNPGAKYRAK